MALHPRSCGLPEGNSVEAQRENGTVWPVSYYSLKEDRGWEGGGVSRNQYCGLRPAIWKKMGPGAPRISVIFVSLGIPFLSKSSSDSPQIHREGKVRHPEGTTEATEAGQRAEPGEEKENSVAQRPQPDAWMEERQEHLERQAWKPGSLGTNC